MMTVPRQVEVTAGRSRILPVLKAVLADLQPSLTVLDAEVSGKVATVNLGYTASLLEKQEMFLLCRTISDTLCANLDIDGVNVLVAGRAIGIDVRNTLPTGVFTPQRAENPNELWGRTSALVPELGESLKGKSFTATAALYFPVKGMAGIFPEARSLSFSSLDPADMAGTLLAALSDNGMSRAGTLCLPDLVAGLSQPPTMEEQAATARRELIFRFKPELNEQLALFGVTRSAFLASLVYTMTTFLPQITYVKVWMGNEQVQSVTPSSPYLADTPIVFEGGGMRRTDFSAMLMDFANLYFALDGKLVSTLRPVPWQNKANPRFLLQQLALGSKNYDTVTGLSPVMDAAYQDAQLLGISLEGDTLALNLGEVFVKGDDTTVYAIMNTLLPAAGAPKGCLFVGGVQPVEEPGGICWQGYFRENYGIVTELPLG